jgi:PTH1 family peptidyl-tRNA hydrolase
MASSTPLKTPRRFLFIASIGNPRPYRTTRHSAGHLLLDALIPHLLPRIPLVSAATSAPQPLFYKTWHSPSLMNVSGRKLVRELQRWMATAQTDILERVVQAGHVRVEQPESDVSVPDPATSSWQRRGIDPRTLRQLEPTLVILHDELEAPLGKVRVKRGGPEAASLRGHRGLISVMEQLKAKKLYPPAQSRGGGGGGAGGLSVVRIGVGIGRPDSREKGSVADYVLTEMNPRELAAVRAAVGPVLDILEDELYREPEPVVRT